MTPSPTKTSVTIYHNPRCSKSRETLALLQEHNITPDVVLYLDTPPDAATLAQLIKQLGFTSARELMRTKEEIYQQLGLSDAALTDAQLIQAMIDNPKLIERPIVVAQGQARIGRPPEQVLEIL
ncbi:arsenate reductase (glutaredoxin) [Pectobacterium carotovorum]|uniref:arsenate reductase (glutaredoxin) n=1 Tax=Pectobacterium carotovorum TaxID=554 RepID=UPI00050345F0|nr:arsenate reductase (glutaredoxin) [Pectobacterium carotovorum]KAA3666889.1 arsenate reductase (glutaredoxin) [Pectobacterium carotovorum subsp. carotovorum]KFX00378.1 arsenate reductase [Pectobacterium carotovorum subsp. carotovorum]KML71404.1 arsenate reductase [Pectobacterium carotovorum subsp. carotovorum ICMP 5702]UCZ80688.1 arsenate reductase (glutaredoxin) [Pectobacterium carotovorum]WDG00109.1 arsenate reductase (glutaredoxin) [Pectobacterium carotovorum subsp. carotovorum]